MTPVDFRSRMRRVVALGLVACASTFAIADEPKGKEIPPNEGKAEIITLFNGTDLAGWKGDDRFWSVADGAIVGKNTQPVKVSTYLTTEQHFRDFRLTVRVKLVESEMHSGIAFWGRTAPEYDDPHTYAGYLVIFPSGWGMYELFGRRSLPVDATPAKKVGRQHDWNDLEILTRGNRVRVAVNGSPVIDWRDPEPDRIKPGPIGLQLHSNSVPQEVRFKNITVETFPKDDRLLTVRQ